MISAVSLADGSLVRGINVAILENRWTTVSITMLLSEGGNR